MTLHSPFMQPAWSDCRKYGFEFLCACVGEIVGDIAISAQRSCHRHSISDRFAKSVFGLQENRSSHFHAAKSPSGVQVLVDSRGCSAPSPERGRSITLVLEPLWIASKIKWNVTVARYEHLSDLGNGIRYCEPVSSFGYSDANWPPSQIVRTHSGA
jgi:hypothetical protein